MLQVINPATDAVIAELPTDTAATVATKVDAARQAQESWAAMPLRDRLEIIRRFQQELLKQVEPLALTLTAEMGKPIQQARAEVKTTASRIEFFLQEAASVLADETVLVDTVHGLMEQISHEPLGVIANISAWNYPYFVGSNVFIPALLAGNAVVYKPSEFAAMTGLAIADLMQASGMPDGVWQTVIGAGAIGAALLDCPLDGVFFTGSYPTGCKVAAAAARQLMKVQLELGGKDPAYIAADVDGAAIAAAVADGAFYNTGQSCCALERIYIHAAVYEPFVEKFIETVEGFAIGDPGDETTYIGPLSRKAQLAVLSAQVEDAIAKGATLRCGGYPLDRPGNFFAPAVLTDVTHAMAVMREESFGPIIGLQKVSSDQEAIELMADTEYGLTASVYTPSQERAQTILRQLKTGTAYWNCCDRVSPRLPWSGRLHSGIGLTLSKYGIQTFTTPKAWHLSSL